ncbi:MAG: hypothetical protein GX493_10390 [Firmicutes bacterium]|nr:hypothetical protein [Bacillota bacterium]
MFWRNSLVAPFGVQTIDSSVNFGINETNISKAADAYRLYEITGDTVYRDAAIQAVQWTFGVNPFDISFVCGIGSNYPVHLHSRLDADADTNPNSSIILPGFMVCGPIWADTLNPNSVHPWYEDRPLANDGSNQWRYNEHSISIQYGLLDLIVALAYGTTGGSPPGSFNLSSPANGATGVSTSPTLSWTTSSGATSYTLVVDDNSDYSSPVFNQDVGNVTSKQISGLAYATTYYWKVIAHNANGDTPASNNSFSFTTEAVPSLPSGISMEAENMALTNYVVNDNSAASGGKLIKLSGYGVTGTAAYSFSGTSGTYDIKVSYFDENDGACTFKLYVDGTVVDQWTADQNLGSANPDATTLTRRTKAGVSIANGAEIKIEATQNSEEWGRVDKIEVTPSVWVKEAEAMTLTNYVVNTNSAASGGQLIKLSGYGVTGTAVCSFTGSSGTYNIKVYYFDENDGTCTFKLYVGGTVVDQWTANQNLGSADPVAATLTSRTVTGVAIANGAEIKIEATQNSEEWGRVDKIEFYII